MDCIAVLSVVFLVPATEFWDRTLKGDGNRSSQIPSDSLFLSHLVICHLLLSEVCNLYGIIRWSWETKDKFVRWTHHYSTKTQTFLMNSY